MLLAIDIGNTNITFGIFKGNKIIKRFSISTRFFNLKKLKASLGKLTLDDSIISSVVPSATKSLQQILKRLLGKEPYNIGKDIQVPIKNLYRYPGQVGQDRLVNAYAASRLYGAPLIIVDFGTAMTFDIVSKNKEYLGGMILPGLNISLDALAKKTALLPRIKLSKPREFIGKDTKNSMLSGIVYGFAELTDELTKMIKQRIGKNAKVIGTGGDIDLMSKYCAGFNKIDKVLILKGLNLIYKTVK